MSALSASIRELPIHQFINRAIFKLSGGVFTLAPTGPSQGRVLISYTTFPFLDTREKMLDGHSNRWECRRIAEEFHLRGYTVDIIDSNNYSFRPKHPYVYCVDIGESLERLAPQLNKECILIYHATGAHWLFWNAVEYERLADIQRRRGVTIIPKRQSVPTRGPDIAHEISSVCGKFPESTYDFLKKDLYHIPVTSTHTYPTLERNFTTPVKQFLWFGGAGVVRKGLDLVLEAFAGMPEHTLVVCGKYEGEKDFVDAFRKELFDTPNILAAGYMDPSSNAFHSILKESVGIVYPSSAEGCATSVVLTMHAGLIPIVSKETGVETGDFGTTLRENTVSVIQDAVREIAAKPANELLLRSQATREYTLTHHTRELFGQTYASFVDMLEKKYRGK